MKLEIMGSKKQFNARARELAKDGYQLVRESSSNIYVFMPHGIAAYRPGIEREIALKQGWKQG